MFNKVTYFPIGKILLVCPFLCAEHTEYTIEGIRVSQFYTTHCTNDGRTEILRALSHILPMTAIGDNKTVLLWKRSVFFIATTFLKCIQRFFIIHITDALIIENWRYIILEVVLTHWPTNDIASLKQEVVQVLYPFQLQLLRSLGLVGHPQ